MTTPGVFLVQSSMASPLHPGLPGNHHADCSGGPAKLSRLASIARLSVDRLPEVPALPKLAPRPSIRGLCPCPTRAPRILSLSRRGAIQSLGLSLRMRTHASPRLVLVAGSYNALRVARGGRALASGACDSV